MPHYEYICTNCNNEFDDLIKTSDRNKPTKKACVKCKKKKIILKISSTQIIDPVTLGLKTSSSSFKELMKYHAKKNPRGSLKDKI